MKRPRAGCFVDSLEHSRVVDTGWLSSCVSDASRALRLTVEQEDAATPDGVPVEYVMQPFSIRLAFRGRHWLTVAFELGHDEIGSTKRHDLRVADDLIRLFESSGLETPAPIPVLALDHQIAQKLHACTYVNPKTGQDERAHDPRRPTDPRTRRNDRHGRRRRNR